MSRQVQTIFLASPSERETIFAVIQLLDSFIGYHFSDDSDYVTWSFGYNRQIARCTMPYHADVAISNHFNLVLEYREPDHAMIVRLWTCMSDDKPISRNYLVDRSEDMDSLAAHIHSSLSTILVTDYTMQANVSAVKSKLQQIMSDMPSEKKVVFLSSLETMLTDTLSDSSDDPEE
jgi:hypothetical protein